MLPISTEAFSVSQGSKQKILKAYAGATIIYRNCAVYKIERIDFLGYWGNSFLSKLFSAVNGGTRRIEVHLLAAPRNLDDVKRLVLGYLPEDRKIPEPFFPATQPLEEVMRRINGAASCSEIFDILNVPSAENALDAL